jgi:hypothetical protein
MASLDILKQFIRGQASVDEPPAGGREDRNCPRADYRCVL